MHEYLTRALQLVKKWLQAGMHAMQMCRQYLALAWRRVSDLVRHYVPIIRQSCAIHTRNVWQHTLRLCRICFNHAARLTRRAIVIATVFGIRIAELLRYYTPIVRAFIVKTFRLCLDHVLRFVCRVIFMTTVLGIRIAEWLRYYTPIVRTFIVKTFRLCLDHTLRFVRRVIFMATVLGIRITELLRHYIPIVWQFIKINSGKAWHCTLRFCRSCLELSASFLRWTVFLVTTGCQKTYAFLCHYTPIVLHYLVTRLQIAWRATVDFCRSGLQHTINITQAIVRGIFAAGVLVIGFVYSLVRRIALAGAASCRWIIARVRHYLPIILRATSRGLQVTAQILVAAGRWCIQIAGRLVRATVRIVLSILALAAKIILGLLLTVKNILLFVARALITFCRVAGRYIRYSVRYLLHTSRTIAARAGERLYQYVLLTRLNKPIGILLLLWPTLWALWIAADGTPDLPILLIFICGVILMRSAGCVINDLADRDFDAHVSRTRQRPLATGKVTPKEALMVAGVLILCAFLLVLQLNLLTIGLSVVGVLLAIIYPFTKRYTYMPQFFLGLAFGWAVPMAFAAQTGIVPPIGWILLMATVLWALVYDTMYAMVDRDEDIRLGIKSTAILFEEADRFIIGVIQLLVVLTLLLVGSRLGFNRFYYAGLAIASLLFIYQQHLIRDRIPEQCFMAFLNNHWFGAMVFGGILMNYQYE
jgi:4-hydroxybenzoate polyprenyltransferase